MKLRKLAALGMSLCLGAALAACGGSSSGGSSSGGSSAGSYDSAEALAELLNAFLGGGSSGISGFDSGRQSVSAPQSSASPFEDLEDDGDLPF